MTARSAELEGDKQLNLCKMRLRSESAAEVEFCLKILSDLSWKLYLFGKEVPPDSSILEVVPPSLTTGDSVARLLRCISSARPCLGSSDDKFMALLPSRKGLFRDPTGMSYVFVPKYVYFFVFCYHT